VRHFRIFFKKVEMATWEGDALSEADAIALAETWFQTAQKVEVYTGREIEEVK